MVLYLAFSFITIGTPSIGSESIPLTMPEIRAFWARKTVTKQIKTKKICDLRAFRNYNQLTNIHRYYYYINQLFCKS